MKYLLDANIFITAKNLHYGFDFVPGFWDWLDQSHSHGFVWSTRKVREELLAGEDVLSEWAAQRDSLFLAPDAQVTGSMQRLATWAHSGAYYPTAVSDFLSVADFELVAYAHSHEFTVVTHERPQPGARKRIRIPDACDALNVDWVGPYTMLRERGAQFVLY